MAEYLLYISAAILVKLM